MKPKPKKNKVPEFKATVHGATFIRNLLVTITKTADGENEYLQIMSEDTVSVNVVLVARTITLTDYRLLPRSLKPVPRV